MTVVLLLVALGGAQAAPEPACDAKALQKELADSSPTAIPATYKKLVGCDEAAAKATAPQAFERMLAGNDANEAVVSAIGVGAGAEARAWMGKLQPDQRSQTIAWLGGKCQGDPLVETFFIESHSALGVKFFEDRWFRGLAECRTEKIQGLLTASLDAETKAKAGADRALFYALLEVYARNLGAAAVPKLADLAGTLTNENDLTYIVSAFADAANVGGKEGTNPDASAKAVATLAKLGPTLPPKAIEQARTTLLALGSEQVADSFSGYRWPDRKRDGAYHYAAVASQIVTCKNGKKQATLHWADVTEPGNLWPEQVQLLIGEKLEAEWHLDEAAAKCKGTGEIAYAMPGEPLESEAARDVWLEAQRKAFVGKTTGFDKVAETRHETVGM